MFALQAQFHGRVSEKFGDLDAAPRLADKDGPIQEKDLTFAQRFQRGRRQRSTAGRPLQKTSNQTILQPLIERSQPSRLQEVCKRGKALQSPNSIAYNLVESVLGPQYIVGINAKAKIVRSSVVAVTDGALVRPIERRVHGRD